MTIVDNGQNLSVERARAAARATRTARLMPVQRIASAVGPHPSGIVETLAAVTGRGRCGSVARSILNKRGSGAAKLLGDPVPWAPAAARAAASDPSLWEAARDPSTGIWSSVVLEHLSAQPRADVRLVAAESPRSAASALRRLSGDTAAALSGTSDQCEIRWSVAHNPACPSTMLTALASDDDLVVRGWVADNGA